MKKSLIVLLVLLVGMGITLFVLYSDKSPAQNTSTEARPSPPLTVERARKLESLFASRDKSQAESGLAAGLRTGKWPSAGQQANIVINTASFRSFGDYGQCMAVMNGTWVIIDLQYDGNEWLVFATEKGK